MQSYEWLCCCQAAKKKKAIDRAEASEPSVPLHVSLDSPNHADCVSGLGGSAFSRRLIVQAMLYSSESDVERLKASPYQTLTIASTLAGRILLLSAASS